MTTEPNAKRGNLWVVRDYDAQVEFLFRDVMAFYKGASDPDFQELQSEGEPFISEIHVEVSTGWIETYVNERKMVNLGDDGKPHYPVFKELSIPPQAEVFIEGE
ncbi:hypothetical protein EYZ11_011788 [Aspergillus tanneri]|uniref:EthD domain-containing protein n=1 Tax=Aspergillus tanneri TaxID=1220188 RepID=A0A4S3J277_9EURO|nr:uncharacterized protein ATNIH1004_006626 [Aspergillus tanneri]KAA8647924.1 hypothetical protein ATNIH1004_006626 [Aspergillus tanneri]THC88765.1 hypothetical protein EYZ11_011788 [Aspergillus tanneri]